MVSVPAPGRIGMPVLLIMIGDVMRFLFSDDAECHDPIEELAADIAGLPHPLRGRLLDQLVEARLLDAGMDLLRPGDVWHGVALARLDLRSADLERETAGADHRDAELAGQAVDRAAHHPSERIAALRGRQRFDEGVDPDRHYRGWDAVGEIMQRHRHGMVDAELLGHREVKSIPDAN